MQRKDDSVYTDVAAGMAHVLMLDKNGTAYGQGGNMREQLGEGGKTKTNDVSSNLYEAYGNSVLEPKRFDIPEFVTSISAGKYHSVFLSRNSFFNIL